MPMYIIHPQTFPLKDWAQHNAPFHNKKNSKVTFVGQISLALPSYTNKLRLCLLTHAHSSHACCTSACKHLWNCRKIAQCISSPWMHDSHQISKYPLDNFCASRPCLKPRSALYQCPKALGLISIYLPFSDHSIRTRISRLAFLSRTIILGTSHLGAELPWAIKLHRKPSRGRKPEFDRGQTG